MQTSATKYRLLLVDADPKSLRVLDVSLKKAGFQVVAASGGVQALAAMEAQTPDLIISDTHMPEMDGFELCRRIKQRVEWAKVPFIFLSSRKSIEEKIRGLELGVEDYLTKPIYIKEITTRVRMLLQRAQRERLESRRDGRTKFAGQLADIGVVDLVQTIEINRKSGIIHVEGREGKRGEIYFRDGKIVDAEAGRLSGADAVYRLFAWPEGNFEMEFKVIRRKDVIELSPQALLMEGMRRLDEWARILDKTPPMDAVLEVDYHLMAERLSEIPDEVNSVLRLFDGRRTIMQVIEDGDFPDLEALAIVAKLHAEGFTRETSREPRWEDALVPARVERWLTEEGSTPPPVEAARPTPRGHSAYDEDRPDRDRDDNRYEDPRPSSPRTMESGGAVIPFRTLSGHESFAASGAIAAATAPAPRPPVATPSAPTPPFPPAPPQQPAVAAPPVVYAPPPVVYAPPPPVVHAPPPVVYAPPPPVATPSPPPMASAAPGVTPTVVHHVEAPRHEPTPTPVSRAFSPASSASNPFEPEDTLVVALNAGRRKRATIVIGGVAAGVVLAVTVLNMRGGQSEAPAVAAPPAATATVAPVPTPVAAPAAAPAHAAAAPAPAPAPAAAIPAPTPAPAPVAAAPAPTPAPAPAPAPAAAASPVDTDQERLACRKAYNNGRGKYKDVVAACEKALEVNPKAADAMVMLANVELDRGRHKEALVWAIRAIEIDPTIPEAYVFIGGAKQLAGSKVQAKAAYERYLELAPTGKYAGDLKTILKSL